MSATPAAPFRDFILVDFDGTLARCDLGNLFFRRFVSDGDSWRRLIDDWKESRVSARECLARECDLARASRAQALAFIDEFDLAPGATSFVAAARAAGHEIEVASDGLGFYIERLLARAGLRVPFSANELLFCDDGSLVPRFASSGPEVALREGRLAQAVPGGTEGCGACGNCKGARIRAARASAAYRRHVLVGDGLSDRCAATAADVVYAKDDLLVWCRNRGLEARPFAHLEDVVRAEGWIRDAEERARVLPGARASG